MPPLPPSFISRQLEELNLLKCSLIQDEQIHFTPPSSSDANAWTALLDSYPDQPEDAALPESAARFQVRCKDVPVWFEIELPDMKEGANLLAVGSLVAVRGDGISRTEQEKWQQIVKDLAAGLSDSEYPVFELMSTHLLPLLHAEADSKAQDEEAAVSSQAKSSPTNAGSSTEPIYHALLTSHHLVSPTKRRDMQAWSSQLHVAGFAKVGYPGVIYCEGAQRSVEEFVANVKAMQWLALRVRFVEPLPVEMAEQSGAEEKKRWMEFEKMGEVVQEMRKLRRESYVVEMGIGSAGT